MNTIRQALTAISFLLLIGTVSGEPSRIILLRHSEKENAYALCDVGQQRSIALKMQYLGQGSERSLFENRPPAAFIATTLHTLELASPAADSWGLPVITYSVVPLRNNDKSESTDWVTRQTQRAAADVMNSTRWKGQTVVMVWEHKHIANKKLARSSPDLLVDLRQLLKLDQLPERYRAEVPKTWSGANYNYFWIIDYDDTGQPKKFASVRQDFSGEFAGIPNNDWGVPEALPALSKCKHWE